MKKAAAVALAGALLVGCGSDGPQADTAAQERAAARRAAAVKAAKDHARREAAYEACEATLGELQDELAELDSRLSIGLNYSDYGTKVADVKVVYDRLDWDRLGDDIGCLGGVGVPLERAFNQHVRAQSAWSACFDDWDCDNDSVTPKLQDHWARASRGVERAKRNLQKMDPGPAPYVPAGPSEGDVGAAGSQ